MLTTKLFTILKHVAKAKYRQIRMNRKLTGFLHHQHSPVDSPEIANEEVADGEQLTHPCRDVDDEDF